jgi:tyrosinase
VYVTLPENGTPADRRRTLAGSVALFGLRRASAKDGQHGGEGLTFVLDFTPLIDQLHLANALDVDSLRVNVVPDRPLPDKTEVTVGRISLYRQEF